MTKTTVLEHMVFDSGNSGMHVRILEKLDYANQPHYILEVEHGAFSQHSKMSFPLGPPKMAGYIADAVARTTQRMQKAQDEAGLHVAGKYQPFDRLSERWVPQIRDGLRSRNVYEELSIATENDTYGAYLGLDWLTPDGAFVRFELDPGLRKVETHDLNGAQGAACGPTPGGYGSGGTDKVYEPDEIGMSLREASEARVRAGRPPLDGLRWWDAVDTLQTRHVSPGDEPSKVDFDYDPTPYILANVQDDELELALRLYVFQGRAFLKDKDRRDRFLEGLADRFKVPFEELKGQLAVIRQELS